MVDINWDNMANWTIRDVELAADNAPCQFTEKLRRMATELDALRRERKAAVRHGHWIFGSTLGHSYMKCSECCVSQDGQTACWSFCPNCGATMVEEVEYETKRIDPARV